MASESEANRPQAAIRAVNLTKRFGKRLSVDGLSFNVYPGELYALLGDNGAGKTTTINMLTTLLEPSAGQFFICGFDGIKQSERTKGAFGVVSQEVALYQELTAYENLSFIADLYGITGDDAHRRIEKLLQQADLADRAHDLAGNLSGGMQRKLSIAIAMLHEPRVIFMDEPTVGLDPASRRQIWQQLKELKASGVTVLLTTHYLEEAELLADRIGIIRRGKLIIEGTIAELRNRLERLRRVTVSVTHGADRELLKRKAAAANEDNKGGEVDYDSSREILIFKHSKDLPLTDYLSKTLAWLEQEKIPFDKFATTEPNLEEIFLEIQAGELASEEAH